MGTVTPFQLASGKTLRGWGVFGWWLAAILFGAAIAKGQSIQAVPLSRGWNLVSLQVGDPAGIPVIQIADHLDRKASLLSLWTYDPIAHDFKSYHRRNSEYPSDLTTVQPGQGFWIEVDSDTTLRMEGSEWRGNFVLVPGWNLVGFPGLETEVSGGIPLDSVLGALAEQIPQVWTFESGSSVSGGQRYVGRECPDLPCDVVFAEEEWKSICLIRRGPQGLAKKPSLQEMILLIASFGGHVGRRSDGSPGAEVMWRGMQRLRCFALAWQTFGQNTS